MNSGPPPDTTSALRQFEQAVVASPHNLVSMRAKSELWDRHIQEAVALAHRLPGPGRLLDVGSGGGLPGLVIAIERPDLRVVLLDSSRKKTQFLEETVEQLDLGVKVVRGRAEDLRTGPLARQFDLVTARAVAPLSRLLGWTLPFLVPGGLVYAVKGARWEEELDAAAGELRTWDGQVVATPRDEGLARDPRLVVIRRATPGGAV